MIIIDWLKTNGVSLILALLLAIAVWVVATQETNPISEGQFASPVTIEYLGKAENLLITNSPVSTVTISVRATDKTWRDLTVENFRVVADLSALSAGEHSVPIIVEILDSRAIPLSVTPDHATVFLEDISRRDAVPVQLMINGTLPTGYRSEKGIIDPASVSVTGAQSLVDLVGEIRATINIDGLREEYSQQVQLAALDNDGNIIGNLTLNPAAVRVTIPIYQEADFAQLAVRVYNENIQPAPGYNITNITADPPLVSVRGDPDILRTLTTIETRPITLQGVKETTRYPVQLNPPEGITIEGAQTVDVIITVEAQPAFRVFEVPIRVIGLGEGLQAVLLPSSAVVSTSGPLPVLDILNEQEDIIATIDLTDLEPGSYQISDLDIQFINISEDDFRKIVLESVLPTLIEVEITEIEQDNSP